MKRILSIYKKVSTRRAAAMMLSVCMMFTLTPPVSFAYTEERISVVSFAALPEDVREQAVSLGTPEEDLTLPDTLKAVVYSISEEPVRLPPASTDGELIQGEPSTEEETPPIEEEASPSERESPIEEEITPPASEMLPEEEELEKSSPAQESAQPKESDAPVTEAETGISESSGRQAEAEEIEQVSVSSVKMKVLSSDTSAQKIFILSDTRTSLSAASSNADGTEPEETEKSITIRSVTWDSDPIYDPDTVGTYTFTAVLPDGYAVEDGVSLPEITVIVEETTQETVEKVIALIDALPTVDEIYEGMVGDSDPSYGEWLIGIRKTIADIRAAKNAYDALGDEEKALIDGEYTDKLFDLAGLADRLAEAAVLAETGTAAGGTVASGATQDTIDAAFGSGNATLNGTTITLGNDITLTGTITFTSGTFTIELAGHTITRNDFEGQGLVFDNTNITINGPGTIRTVEGYVCEDGNKSLIYLNNATAEFHNFAIRVSGTDAYGVRMDKSTFKGTEWTLEGGGSFGLPPDPDNKEDTSEITLTNCTISSSGNIPIDTKSKGVKVAIHGGSYIHYDNGASSNFTAVLQTVGPLTITGGTFHEMGKGHAINPQGQEGMNIPVLIEGGEFISDAQNALYVSLQPSITITGGKFIAGGDGSGISGTSPAAPQLIISGGTFIGSGSGHGFNVRKNMSNKISISGGTFTAGAGGKSFSINSANTTYSDVNDLLKDNTYVYKDADGKELTVSGLTIDQSPVTVALKNDPTLQNLVVEGCTLSPAFDKDTVSYTATAASSVDKIGITATLSDSDAAMTIQNGDSDTPKPLENAVKYDQPLNVGENKIMILVTNNKGEATKTMTYTLTVTREAPPGSAVTVTPHKDGAAWTDSGRSYKLSPDRGITFLTDLNTVPDGMYSVYEADGTDTGADVTVNGAAASVTVDYYTVTFYNGSEACTDPAPQIVLKTVGRVAKPSADPVKNGYTFAGWKTANGGATAFDFTNAVITAKTNLYAGWTPVSYQISYVLDGATASNPASYTIESGAITLNNPIRTGYDFTGWSGTGLTGDTNKTVTILTGSTGDRSYTAHWKEQTYQITYHLDGYNAPSGDCSYTYGTGKTLPVPSRTGYTFDGWYDNSSCTGGKLTSVSNTDTGNKEFWGKWNANSYTVIFHGSSHTGGSMERQSFTYGTAQKLTANAFTREYAVIYNHNYNDSKNTTARASHTFDGWATSINGAKTYDDGQSVTDLTFVKGGEVSLYACWSGGSVILETPVRSGYTFDGWYQESGCSNKIGEGGDSYKPAADITLYAKWTDSENPKISVSTAPEGWQKGDVPLSLTFSDNVGVSGLYVKIDNGAYSGLPGIDSGGTYLAASEGEHSYTFKVEDAAGNIAETAPVTVKLDKTAPTIGMITYDPEHQSFWEWILGKTSLEITVPVTDTGSGAHHITYVLTPVGGSAQTEKTVTVGSEGTAKFTVAKDFKGEISITAYDEAGNSRTASVIKMAVEDNPPVMTVTDGTEEFGSRWYQTAQTIHVTVKDGEQDSSTEGGLNTVTVTTDEPNEQTLFTRPAGQLTYTAENLTFPAGEGEHSYEFTAVDNAGNQTVTSVTVKQDTTAPVISSAKASEINDDNANFTFNTDDTGTYYYIVKPSGEAAPDLEEIFIENGADTAAAGSPTIFTVNGLNANTDYVLYLAVKDKAGNKSAGAVSVSFKTAKAGVAGTVTLDNTTPRYGDTLTARADITSENPGSLTFEWYRGETKINEAAGNSYTVSKIDVGKSITVKVTAANYTGSRSCTPTAAVAKRQISVVAIAEDKTYDGTDTASVSITPDGVLSGDSVSVTAVGRFSDANAGKDKTVTLSNVTVDGTDKGYYELSQQPDNPKATIQKASAAVTNLPTVTLYYGQKLEDAVISGGTATPTGSWVWENPSTVLKEGGKQNAVYCPEDTNNYSDSAKIQLTVTVRAVQPTVILSVSPKEQTAGSEVTVSATAANPYAASGVEAPPIPSLTYQIGDGTVLEIKGNQFTIPRETQKNIKITVTAKTSAVDGRYLAHSVTDTVKVVDRTVLTEEQFNLIMPGWTYGDAESMPLAGITETDTNGVFTYSYRTDGSVHWTNELPKTVSGHVKAGTYQIKAEYTGERYTGSKTVSFTVTKKELTAIYEGETVLTGEVPILSVKVTGFIAGEGENEAGGIRKAEGYTAPKVPFLEGTEKAETYKLMPEGGQADNYSFRYREGTLTVAKRTYTLAIEPGTLNFAPESPGYGSPASKTVTVKNTGNSNVTLTPPASNKGPDSEYTIGALTANTLAAGETASFTVQPKTGLPAGIHNETVTVRNDHAAEAGVELKFEVKSSGSQSGSGSGGGGGQSGGGENNSGSEPAPAPKPTPIPVPTPAPVPDIAPTQETTPTPVPEHKETADEKPAEEKTALEFPKGEDVRTVTAEVKDGKIQAETGEKVETGATEKDQKDNAATVLTVGDGAVIVTVSEIDGKRMARVSDTVAVVNAVLTNHEKALVNEGETIEIRIDVKKMTDNIPKQDKQLVEEGLEAYQKEVPDLELGMYVDISMFMRVGDNDWNAVKSIDDPVEITIEIPEELQKVSADFFIIRTHEGEYILLKDTDDDPATITVKTQLFSTYAITYQLKEKQTVEKAASVSQDHTPKCSLCHSCPTILGICCFIWLAVIIVLAAAAILWIMCRKRTGTS